MTEHETFMREALGLALKGWPAVAPNPLVGSVIVRSGEIVAEGYHSEFGAPHAEVNAVRNLPAAVSPSECTLYVSLEPCDHEGKTPPCTDLILEKGFKKVVIATVDPNPAVAGRGIRKLRANGVEVVEGVLAADAKAQNRRFFTFHEKKRPYIILKWAISADGFISPPGKPSPEKKIISRKEARMEVHRLRSETMGILVGKNTVLSDNPQLTVRLVKGKNPVRIFIDRKLNVPEQYNVFNKEAETIVFNTIREQKSGNVRYVKLDEVTDLSRQILDRLYEFNIQSLLVEGGSKLLQGLIDQRLWDEALVFQNPDLYFKQGLKGPVFALQNTFELVGEDKLFRHINYDY